MQPNTRKPSELFNAGRAMVIKKYHGAPVNPLWPIWPILKIAFGVLLWVILLRAIP